MKYSQPLDGLRGVAILLVIFFHFEFMLGVGWSGVQLFFVLSGFLITSILLAEKNEPLGFYLKRFYWRRTLRIFPLYYAYLFLVVAVFLVAHIPEELFDYFPYLATYTFNFYPLVSNYSYEDFFFMHFWSLSVEEQFYLVWPLVIFLCNKRQLQVVLVAIIIAAPLTRYFLGEWMFNAGYAHHYVGETVHRFTIGQWDGFAFGAMIPVFGLGAKDVPAGRYLLIALALVLGCGAINAYFLSNGGIAIPFWSFGYQVGEVANYQHVWSYTLFDLLFGMMILYIVLPRNDNHILVKFMANPVLVYFGKISYGLYVYHWIIWMAFNKYLKAKLTVPGMGLLIYLALCLAVASISYFIFERPILRLKDRMLTSPKPAPTNETHPTAI